MPGAGSVPWVHGVASASGHPDARSHIGGRWAATRPSVSSSTRPTCCRPRRFRASPRFAEAVDLLGASVVSVHPKDVVASGHAVAGARRMDYASEFRQLARLPPVPLIVQDAHEDDADRVREDLLRWYDEASTGAFPE
jgi:hypothetical protein